MNCDKCKKITSVRCLDGDSWVCRRCWISPEVVDTCRPFEYGQENPYDPEGSTAHVRDIKQRRWHPEEKRLFYYKPPVSYSFPRG